MINQKVYDALKELARTESIFTYRQLNEKCNLGLDWSGDSDRNKIGEILGDISKEEVKNGRPMISVLVNNAMTTMPGDGFFKLAEELEIKKPEESDVEFRAKEVKRVFTYWRDK